MSVRRHCGTSKLNKKVKFSFSPNSPLKPIGKIDVLFVGNNKVHALPNDSFLNIMSKQMSEEVGKIHGDIASGKNWPAKRKYRSELDEVLNRNIEVFEADDLVKN